MKKRTSRREPTLRTARIVYLLARGKKLTTMEIAEMLDISRFGALLMMNVIASSHYVPVTCIDGYWQIVEVTSTAKL